jgi:hypothetical protein
LILLLKLIEQEPLTHSEHPSSTLFLVGSSYSVFNILCSSILFLLKTEQDEPTKNRVELHRILKTELDEPTKNRVELHRILKTEQDEPTKNSVELHRILKTEQDEPTKNRVAV